MIERDRGKLQTQFETKGGWSEHNDEREIERKTIGDTHERDNDRVLTKRCSLKTLIMHPYNNVILDFLNCVRGKAPADHVQFLARFVSLRSFRTLSLAQCCLS